MNPANIVVSDLKTDDVSPRSIVKKGIDDQWLLTRLHTAIQVHGSIPTDGKTSLTSNQMKVGVALIQSELGAFEQTMNTLSGGGAEKALKERRERLVTFLGKNNFSEEDAYCLVHGEYPRGRVDPRGRVAQAAMTIYKNMKIIDGYIVYFSDCVYAKASAVLSKGPALFRAVLQKMPDVVRLSAIVQYIAPDRKAPVRPVSPPPTPKVMDEKKADEKKGDGESKQGESDVLRPPVSVEKKQNNHLLPSSPRRQPKEHKRAVSMVPMGKRANGQPRAPQYANMAQVQSCGEKVLARIKNSYVYRGLEWSWNYLVPEEIKGDIKDQIKSLYKRPVREFVRWTGRTAAALVVGSIAKRLGLFG